MQLGLPFESDTFAPAGVHPIAPGSSNSIARTSESSIAPIYFVRHRWARHYRLRVEPDGRARVTIPRGGSRREANAFAERHLDWITVQRSQLLSRAQVDDAAAWRKHAEVLLPPRLYELARRHALEVAKVSIRNQRTRWGSCGRDGHICLNWRLVLMPDWVRDYVLIHELMHLRRLDHSRRYWQLVAAACPEYQEARQWLRLHGPSLR